jgi:hypothetical protein
MTTPVASPQAVLDTLRLLRRADRGVFGLFSAGVVTCTDWEAARANVRAAYRDFRASAPDPASVAEVDEQMAKDAPDILAALRLY